MNHCNLPHTPNGGQHEGRGRTLCLGKKGKQALKQLYFRKNFTNVNPYTFAYAEKHYNHELTGLFLVASLSLLRRPELNCMNSLG